MEALGGRSKKRELKERGGEKVNGLLAHEGTSIAEEKKDL